MSIERLAMAARGQMIMEVCGPVQRGPIYHNDVGPFDCDVCGKEWTRQTIVLAKTVPLDYLAERRQPASACMFVCAECMGFFLPPK